MQRDMAEVSEMEEMPTMVKVSGIPEASVGGGRKRPASGAAARTADSRDGLSPDRIEARSHRAQRGAQRFTRCVMVLPDDAELAGRRVLDLACRKGLGAFKISDRVGAAGHVVGVDPDPANVARAVERAAEHHWAGDGWRRHLDLLCAELDDLRSVGIEDGSFDIVIVNSVLNVAPRRGAVLREIARVLAPGGYLYHDAVLARQPVPRDVRERLTKTGNVFAAAPTWDEFAGELAAAGFAWCEVAREEALAPERDDADELLDGLAFESAVVQAFA